MLGGGSWGVRGEASPALKPPLPGYHVRDLFKKNLTTIKSLSTRKAGRGHATPHKTAKCWWLLKIEPNAWEGGKGSCAVCVDLQAVGTLSSLVSYIRFWPRGFGQALEKGRVLFLVTTSTLSSLQA